MKKTCPSIFVAFSLSMILFISGCTPAATPVSPEPSPEPKRASQPISTSQASALPEQTTKDDRRTVAEVETLAGFEVKEPTYFPKGVSLDYATYEEPASPGVTLHFKYIHEQYGDMGPFLLLSQEPQTEAPPEAVSCQGFKEGCELLQINDVLVVYRLYASPSGQGADTEGFVWYADGFLFRLHRIAGEPNKIYKDELLKMVESIK